MRSGEPELLGQFDIDCKEFMFVQYMPVKMAGDWTVIIPNNLACFIPLIKAIDGTVDDSDYVYITAKKMFVSAQCAANRSGWHIDGFGTDDINFIWSDSIPTEFCIQDFELSDDHDISLQQMEQQARAENIKTYPNNSLLGLNSSMVHRVSTLPFEGCRTFMKISISKEKYNLIGNAHNYLFDYEWPMIERSATRNHPVG